MRRCWIFFMIFLVGVGLRTAVAAENAQFAVIVNASNTMESVSREDLADIFLKRKTTWPDGLAILPVDQAPDSPVRATFSRDILRRSVAAVQSFWQKQIFSGSAIPPVEKTSNDAVSGYVSANRGAIGYVVVWALDTGRALVKLPPGVKVVRIE